MTNIIILEISYIICKLYLYSVFELCNKNYFLFFIFKGLNKPCFNISNTDYSKPKKFLPILLVAKIPHPEEICK